jgi:hypothetical protein
MLSRAVSSFYNSVMEEKLINAYLDAIYEVKLNEELIVIRVGVANARLESLLNEERISTWAIITAYNPQSVIKSEEENRKSHLRLLERVRDKRTYPSRAIDGSGNWPVEEGLFISDLTKDYAIELAREFNQRAILFGETGSVPELVLC